MFYKKFLFLCLSLIFFTFSSQAQFCFDSYNSEECPYRIISEFSMSKQLDPVYKRDSDFDLALNLGVQRRMEGDFAMGIHLFSYLILASSEFDLQTGIRPRFAYKLTENMEGSFSPGIILSSTLDDLNKFKGISLEGNISWNNQFGAVLRVDKYYSTINGNDTVVNLGIQSHGTTTFYSMGGVIVIGGITVLLLKGLFGV